MSLDTVFSAVPNKLFRKFSGSYMKIPIEVFQKCASRSSIFSELRLFKFFFFSYSINFPGK